MDQDTFSVYGHVTGSDRLGHALIIPLRDTIQQVMFAFNAKSVRLPQEANPVSVVDPEALESHLRGHQSLHQPRLSHEIPERLDGPPNPWHSEVDFGPEHVCATCLAIFSTANALDKHATEAIHEAYKCSCGKGFLMQFLLKRHINIAKDLPKTLLCSLCDNKFTRKHMLKEHWRHYHRVSEARLQLLLGSLETEARADAPYHLGQSPMPTTAASSGTLSQPLSPALDPAGPSVWSSGATTRQQAVGSGGYSFPEAVS